MSSNGDTSQGGRAAQPLDGRARAAIALLIAVIAAALASVWADLGQLDVINRVIDGERVSLEELNDADTRVGLTATAYLIAGVLSILTFLLWYGRAYRNIAALGARDPRWGRRWAIAYWFIPIVSWFRPKQVMNDIWRASDPALDGSAAGWERRPVAALLHWWWAAWILSVFVATYVTRVALDSGLNPTHEQLRGEAIGYLVSDVVDIAAAVLAIMVIRAVTGRQEERRRQHARAELAPHVPPVGPPSPPPRTDLPDEAPRPS